MAESQILSVIRVWAAVAWADGVLAEAEAEGMRRLIRSADLTHEERTAATAFLQEQDRPARRLPPQPQSGIAARHLPRGVPDGGRRSRVRGGRARMLDRLQGLLGIPIEIAIEIEADVPGMVQ